MECLILPRRKEGEGKTQRNPVVSILNKTEDPRREKREDANHGEQKVPWVVVLLPVPLLGEVIKFLGQLLQAHIDGDHLLLDLLHDNCLFLAFHLT
jgi:hypothetical protein